MIILFVYEEFFLVPPEEFVSVVDFIHNCYSHVAYRVTLLQWALNLAFNLVFTLLAPCTICSMVTFSLFYNDGNVFYPDKLFRGFDLRLQNFLLAVDCTSFIMALALLILSSVPMIHRVLLLEYFSPWQMICSWVLVFSSMYGISLITSLLYALLTSISEQIVLDRFYITF